MSDNQPTQPAEVIIQAGIPVLSPWEILQIQRRRVDRDMAEALSRLTGSTPEFWLSVQSGYDYAQARAGQNGVNDGQ